MRKKLLLALALCAALCLASGCVERAAAAAAPAATLLPAAETVEPVSEPSPTAAPTPTPPPTPSPSPSPTPVPTPCPHLLWVNGVCADCGETCGHEEWADGHCVRCSLACAHAEHDKDTLLCARCGQAVPHNFLNSRCDMCGLEPVFSESIVELKNFNAREESGYVETREYLTHDYYTEGQTWGYAPLQKKICVYLPYGYDPSEKYDVMILLHGTGGTESYWLRDMQQITHTPGYAVYTRSLLDNLMATGYCRKMIIATPCFYRDSGNMGDYQRDRDEEQFVKELRNDILPFLVNTYSTYARSDSQEDIAAARRHFAYAGLSMGSIYAYTSVMPQCLDLFGWFGCFSGSDAYMDRLIPALEKAENAQLPIYYFYNSIGAKDSMYDVHHNQYYELTAVVDGLTDGKNAAFTTVKGCSHDYRAWGTGLYNFLQVVFAQPAEE